jgi:hypothetical protein
MSREKRYRQAEKRLSSHRMPDYSGIAADFVQK